MSASLSPTSPAALPAGCILSDSSDVSCRQDPPQSVGAVPRDPMAGKDCAERSTPLVRSSGAIGFTENDRAAAGHESAIEDELEDAINDMALQSALAEDAGDMERAFDFSRRMVSLIRSRSPEHKERLAREHLAMVERSLDDGVGYFAHQGDLARERLGGNA